MDEAKIQVQGIGMYDDKTLKKKIIKLASELQKNAKSGKEIKHLKMVLEH